MCARTELLFLPCGIGSLPNRLVSGRSGFVKIQFFILYHRIPHIDRGSARAVYLRFLCPFGWLQELLHKVPTKSFPLKAETADIHKICSFAFCCMFTADAHYKRCGYGRSFFCKYLCPQGVLEGAILFPLSIRESVPHLVRSFRGSWAY